MECENCKEILNERQMYINACEQIKALQNLLQKRNEMLKEKDNILENYDLDRLKELVQADKAGRILIIQDAELSDEATFNFVNSLLEDLKSGKTEQTK